MKQKVIIISDEEVNNLQKSEAKVQTMEQVFKNFLNEHLKDENANFMDSPVYKKYQEMMFEQKNEFETLKNEVISKYFEQKEISNITSWSINYITSELIINYNGD